jgi:hypothetical protein
METNGTVVVRLEPILEWLKREVATKRRSVAKLRSVKKTILTCRPLPTELFVSLCNIIHLEAPPLIVRKFVDSITHPEELNNVFGDNWSKEQLYTGTRRDGWIQIDDRLPIDIKFEDLTLTITMHWIIKNESDRIQG